MNLETTKNDAYWDTLQYEVQKKKVADIFRLFRENNFEPILIKGWAASRSYPEPAARRSQDIDLAVNPKDYTAAQKFISRRNLYDIDLHCGLRHHDTVEWDDLYGNSRLLELGQTKIRVLRPEDHLRVLCVHWLTDGGAHRERLWDIYWAVANRAPDFDWERCLGVVSEKRKKWIIYTIALARKYLDLDLSGTPLTAEGINIPKWIIKTIEKEWTTEVKLRPLHLCLNDFQELFRQLKRRFPPNPITATIDMEGEFNNQPRIFYQIGDVIFRLKPSAQRIFQRLFRTNRRRSKNERSKNERGEEQGNNTFD